MMQFASWPASQFTEGLKTMCNYLDLVWILGAIAVMGATTVTALCFAVYYGLEAIRLVKRGF